MNIFGMDLDVLCPAKPTPLSVFVLDIRIYQFSLLRERKKVNGVSKEQWKEFKKTILPLFRNIVCFGKLV
jgi:hypothetical protein